MKSTSSRTIYILFTTLQWTLAALQWSSLIAAFYTLRRAFFDMNGTYFCLSIVFFIYIFVFFFLGQYVFIKYIERQRAILRRLKAIYAAQRKNSGIINKIYFWKQKHRLIK